MTGTGREIVLAEILKATVAMRVMIRIEASEYAEPVISTPEADRLAGPRRMRPLNDRLVIWTALRAWRGSALGDPVAGRATSSSIYGT